MARIGGSVLAQVSEQLRSARCIWGGGREPPERPTLVAGPAMVRKWDDHLEAVRHAPVAKVNDARAKYACLDQLKIDPFLQGREVGHATAE